MKQACGVCASDKIVTNSVETEDCGQAYVPTSENIGLARKLGIACFDKFRVYTFSDFLVII
jgi:hypothetical protein